MVSYLIDPLYEEFVINVTLILLYITVTEVLAIFTDADTRIKGVQIEDHEIKQQLFPMRLQFFLRDYLLYQVTSDFKTIRSF